jgi:hypothetical protein
MTTRAKVTCPECQSVLKPTKPLPVGKRVRCPKCGASFIVEPGPGGERPAGRAKPGRGKAAAPAGKKKPPRQPFDDDEEGGDPTYGVVGDKEQEGPDIEYAPDMSIKDLRGPAQEAIVNPSNKLIFVGVLNFLGWLVFLIFLMIPKVFPPDPVPASKVEENKRLEALEAGKNKDNKEAKKKEDDTTIFSLAGYDLRKISWGEFSLWILLVVVGALYSGVLANGAVKIQNLESRGWGIAASIMAMVPLNVGGNLLVGLMVLDIFYDLLFEGAYKTFMLILSLVVIWLLSVGVGVWNLVTLNKPEVVAGFEYKAE